MPREEGLANTARPYCPKAYVYILATQSEGAGCETALKGNVVWPERATIEIRKRSRGANFVRA